MGSPQFAYDKHVMLLCPPVATGVGKSDPREKENDEAKMKKKQNWIKKKGLPVLKMGKKRKKTK